MKSILIRLLCHLGCVWKVVLIFDDGTSVFFTVLSPITSDMLPPFGTRWNNGKMIVGNRVERVIY